jgi:hypothetical protein
MEKIWVICFSWNVSSKMTFFRPKQICKSSSFFGRKNEKKLLNPVRKLQNFYSVIYIYVFYLQYFTVASFRRIV